MQSLRVCVDASLVVALVTSEEHSAVSLALWTTWANQRVQMTAPALLTFEVTSALRRKATRGVMSPEDAQRALETALALEIDLISPSDLALRALTISQELGLSQAYDAFYLAAAERIGAPLWTADRRLRETASPRFDTRWIGDYPA